MSSIINNQYVWADTKKPYDGNRANTGAYLIEGKIELAPCIVVSTNTGAKLATYKMSEALALMASYVAQIESLHDDIINDAIDYEVGIFIRCIVDRDGLHHGFYGESFTSYSYFK